MEANRSSKLMEELYFLIAQNFKQIYFLCENDEQKNQLRKDFADARDNFWEAGKRKFYDNDQLIKLVIFQLLDYQQKLKHALCSLQNCEAVLNTITATVHLGSTLITLGKTERVETTILSPVPGSEGASPGPLSQASCRVWK